MFKALAYVHALLFRLCWWLLKQPIRALWATVLLMLAWLGEKARMWAGLLMAGLVIVLVGRAIMNYAPSSVRRELAIAVLVILLIWAMAVVRATRFTMHDSLRAVRTRQTFKKLDERTAQIPEHAKAIKNATAKKAKGTPVELAWSANRSARREEREKAEQAAEQSEVDRRIAAERERRTAAEQVEHDRELEVLAQEHDPFSDHRR